MKKLSDTEQKYIIRRCAAAISQLQDQGDAVSVLSKIYCELLPDKSPRQGEMMAREALQWVEVFYDTCDEALEDPENQLCGAIAEALSQLSPDAQGQYPSTELLRETARQLLRSDVLSLQTDDAAFDALKNVPAGNAAKETVGEEMFLAVAAVVIYAMAKSRELSDAPEELTLAQAAICVCAEDKLANLQWAAKTGFLESSLVEKRLQSLKAAFISSMLASQIAIGTGGWLLGVPLATTVALCGAALLWLKAPLDNYYSVMGEMIQDEASMIQYRAVTAAPVEIPEERAVQTEQKNSVWPKTNQQEALEAAEVQSKAHTKQSD